MLCFIIRRLLIAIPTILLLIVISFVLMSGPRWPVQCRTPLPPAVLANIEARYGLDQPYCKQMLDDVMNVVTAFDFGPSFKFRDQNVNASSIRVSLSR